MAFATYGANDVPDLVSANSVLGRKLDASEQSDGTIRLAQAYAGSFDVGSYTTGPDTPKQRQIHNVATPTADSDAATKGYVDGHISTLPNVIIAGEPSLSIPSPVGPGSVGNCS